MLKFILSPIATHVVQVYKSSKEYFYNFISKIFTYIDPGHYTSKDYELYKQWIKRYLDKLDGLGIVGNKSTILEVFELQGEEFGEHAVSTKFVFTEPSDDVIAKKDGKAYYIDATGIISELKNYIKQSYQNQGYLAQRIGSGLDKMSPDRMIISFLELYIQYDLINYTGELRNIENIQIVIDYLQELLSKDSIKQNHNFYNCLYSVKQRLEKIKQDLIKREERKKYDTAVNEAQNLSLSVLHSGIEFFHNLINFTGPKESTGSAEYIDHVGILALKNTSKINQWIHTVWLLLEFNISEFHPEQAARIADISKQLVVLGLTEDDIHSLDNICPYIHELSQDRKEDCKKEYWQLIIRLQEGYISLLCNYKILQHLVNKSSDFNAHVNQDQLLEFIAYLRQNLDRIKLDIIALKAYQGEIDSFKIRSEVTERTNKKINKLTACLDKIEHNIEAILANVNIIERVVKSNNDHVASNTIKKGRFIDQFQGMRLICQKGEGMSQNRDAIELEIVRLFNQFKQANIYNDDLLAILKKYFIIAETPGSHGICELKIERNSHEMPDPELLDRSLENTYSRFLISILIDIYNNYNPANTEALSKNTIVRLIKDFLINKVINNNKEILSDVFDIFLLETKKSEELKSSVRDFLDKFKEVISKQFILYDFEKINNELDDLICEGIGKEARDSLVVEYRIIQPEDSFIQSLDIFIDNLLNYIGKQNRYFNFLKNSLVESSSDISTQRRYIIILNNINILYSKTNRFLLDFINLLNKLVYAYLAFESKFKSIYCDGHSDSSSAASSNYQEDLRVLQTLQSKLDLAIRQSQENISSIQKHTQGLLQSIAQSEKSTMSNVRVLLIRYCSYIEQMSLAIFLHANVKSCIYGFNLMFEYVLAKYIIKLIDSECYTDIINILSALKNSNVRISKILTPQLNIIYSILRELGLDLEQYDGHANAHAMSMVVNLWQQYRSIFFRHDGFLQHTESVVLSEEDLRVQQSHQAITETARIP